MRAGTVTFRLPPPLLVLVALTALLGGCRFVCEGDPEAYDRPDDWTQASHCPGAAPDHDKLLNETSVARLEIVVDTSNHNAAMQDLSVKLATAGDTFPNPLWVPVTVRHDGHTWTEVAMRYKGNTALKDAWDKGVRKLSFRLQFDRYEDDHPELDNQRFYGFRKMIFASGHGDPSLMREKLAASIFREGGVPTARTGFARVYLDVSGQGLTFMGLYTMVEDPTDAMLQSQFGDGSGNLYKPERVGAKLKTFVKEDMLKKSNSRAGDWSDVMAFIQALNGDRTDAAAWRARLEKTFDVAGFLRALSLNQAMQNWDAYPFMAHNYYLYGDPGRGGILRWFPWDLTLSLMPRVMKDGTDTGSVLLTGITADLPLVRHLLDDPVYLGKYKEALKAALSGAFEQSKINTRMDAYFQLISPHVTEERAPYTSLKDTSEFTGSLSVGADALKPHVAARHAAVKKALGL